MNTAFEITIDDVIICMKQMGKFCNEEIAVEIFTYKLDTDRIGEVAMYSDDIDVQTEYAYEEIKKQIKKMNL